jgi:hypothetical protein
MKTLKEIIHKKPKIEIDNLESSTNLNNRTIKRFKYETFRNILFLIIGSIITLVTTKISSENGNFNLKKEQIKTTELYKLEKLNQINIQKLKLEINKLKKYR